LERQLQPVDVAQPEQQHRLAWQPQAATTTRTPPQHGNKRRMDFLALGSAPDRQAVKKGLNHAAHFLSDAER
jgi:hypothetical protein